MPFSQLKIELTAKQTEKLKFPHAVHFLYTVCLHQNVMKVEANSRNTFQGMLSTCYRTESGTSALPSIHNKELL